MKNLGFFCLLLSLYLTVVAQQPASEPSTDNVFMALASGKLIPLEHQNAVLHAGGGGFMVAKSKASYEIPGPKSSVRFHAGQPMDFIVRSPLGASGIDPSTFYTLRKLDATKKEREIVIMSGTFTPFGGSSHTDLSRGSVPLTFSKYGESSLKISVASLPPGEYALSFVTPQSVYCFGVD